jgi:hypothetical protein
MRAKLAKAREKPMRKNLTRAVLAALAMFMVAPAFADGPGDRWPERSRAAGARGADDAAANRTASSRAARPHGRHAARQ